MESTKKYSCEYNKTDISNASCSCSINPQKCSSTEHNCVCDHNNCTVAIFCKIHKPYQFNNLFKSSYL